MMLRVKLLLVTLIVWVRRRVAPGFVVVVVRRVGVDGGREDEGRRVVIIGKRTREGDEARVVIVIIGKRRINESAIFLLTKPR